MPSLQVHAATLPSRLTHPQPPTTPGPQAPPARKPTRPPTRPLPPSSPPPPTPLPWLWQCHVCAATYALGATRRCLDDGHVFCAGASTVRRRGRGASSPPVRSTHQPCASAFDYDGWRRCGEWRRGGVGGCAPAGGCWGACDFPSECRWGLMGCGGGAEGGTRVGEDRSGPPAVTFDAIPAGVERRGKESKGGRRSGVLVTPRRRRSFSLVTPRLGPVIEDGDGDDCDLSSTEVDMANADFDAFISMPRENAPPSLVLVETLDFGDSSVASPSMEQTSKAHSPKLRAEERLLTV